MADTSQLSVIRTYLEGLTGTTNDASYPGSTQELQDINRGYLKTAYKYNWPQTLKRNADVVTAQLDRYSLPTDFRRMVFMRQQGVRMFPTDVDHIYENADENYAIALDSNQYILGHLPNTATTTYTMSGSYSSGSSVAVTLLSATGISAGDEIFISDGANSEFTRVQSVSGAIITIALANNHSGVNLYRIVECNYYQYQKQITPLSATTDVPVIPGETHLLIAEYAAYIYYKRIEEPDRAQTHYQNWLEETDEAWLAWGRTEVGATGEMTL